MKTVARLLIGGMLVMTTSCKADSPVASTPAAPAAKVEAVATAAPAATVAATAPVAPVAATAPETPTAAPVASAVEGRVASFCPVKGVITSGDTSTPEGTVFLAYKAALRGTEEAFEDFFGLFASYHGKNKAWIGEAQWTRLLTHVKKYVPDPAKPSYTVCRKEQGNNADSIKIFVQSNDPKKSDPPITLVKEGSAWKIDVFTP